MKELLEELLTQLKLAQSPLVNLLQNGISREEIKNGIEGHNLKIPDGLQDIYFWRNGVKANDQRSWKLTEMFMLSLGIFRPFSISLETYENAKIELWPEFMFPVFQSGAGETYLVNCDIQNPTKFISYFAPADWRFDGLITMFDSLETMVYSISECYKQRAYYYNTGDYRLQINDEREAAICGAINPESDYWNL
jgi:hypothetical protein